MCPFKDSPLKGYICLMDAGIEGGFDVEQEQYEEDVKVVILPDRQEVTSDDLATMSDVVKERVRCLAYSIIVVCSVLVFLLRCVRLIKIIIFY